MPDFYVYVYFRLNGNPCYIGKGKGTRSSVHLRKSHNEHLNRIIKKSGGKIPCVIIKNHMTEREAFDLEIALISAIGREKHGGPLVNLTDGGEGASGYDTKESVRITRSIKQSERWKDPENAERLRSAMKIAANSEKKKQALSERNKKRVWSDAAKEKMAQIKKGKTHSSEARDRMRSAQIGRKHPEHVKKKIALSNMGIKKPPVGEERKKEISAFFKGKKQTKEQIEKRMASSAITKARKKQERKL